MTLAQMREKLRADRDKLNDLRKAASADGATVEDRKAFADAVTACEALVDNIKAAEREEALDAEMSRSAGGSASGQAAHERARERDGEQFVPAQPKTFTNEVALMAAAAAKSRGLAMGGTFKGPADILREEGFEGFLGQIQRRAQQRGMLQKTNQTTVSADGGILLPTPNSGQIIEFLRPNSTFLQAPVKRIPLVGGQYNQPRGATSSTAGYVGEGMKKPVGSPTFNGISMRSKKIAGIVMVTMEALKWPLANLQAYIEGDLRATIGQNIDLACYFGAGSAYTPLGILNRPNVNTFNAATTGTGAFFAAPKAPTVAEIDAMLTRMVLSITDYNIPMGQGFRWVTNWHVLMYMANLRGANGQKIYPELESATPTLKGIPVLVTTQFPNNGGTNTDESTLALIDFSHVLYGEEEDITVRTSTEATIDPGTGTLVHLFQQNMMAILAEAMHDIALEYDQAVSVLTHVRWGSLSAN